MREFTATIVWGINPETSQYEETCRLSPTTEEDHNNISNNYVAKGGEEGLDIAIYPSLTEAMEQCGFNPFDIKYESLSDQENEDRINFLHSHAWNYHTGLIKLIKPKL